MPTPQMKTILAILSFLWSKRDLILAIIPLALEAQRRYVIGGDKKKWVVSQLETVKKFTPDEIDKAIDAVVQLLQWKGIL
jgi:hypothetical protein